MKSNNFIELTQACPGDKNRLCLIRINSISMVNPDNLNPDKFTAISFIGAEDDFVLINESYDSVKAKLLKAP